jgi:hypothetical protein
MIAHSSNSSTIDYYEADLVSAQDYYPFGMIMPGRTVINGNRYRYGYNIQEKVDEVAGSGNHYTAKFWEYDPRVVIRWNQDPKQIIGVSPYAINGNNPIYYTDPNGDFRTKFGANVYKFFHGGEVRKATGGERAGEYFVGKQVEYTGEGAGVAYQRTFDSKISSVAEYGRGAYGAIKNFAKFALGGGGSQTYKEGSFEADMMATSQGVRKNIILHKFEIKKGKSVPFNYAFSPNPKAVVNDLLAFENPFENSISQENVEAHIDVFQSQSFTKLFVGGYVGKMRLVSANTIKVTINNATTANSFLLHAGEIIWGKENGAKRFNDLWNKTPFLNTQNQTFEFTIPLTN